MVLKQADVSGGFFSKCDSKKGLVYFDPSVKESKLFFSHKWFISKLKHCLFQIGMIYEI